MMRWIVSSSLKLRLIVVGVAATMVVYGIAALGDLPVDTLPEFSRPYVEIQTEALGLSAQEVEALITTPLEADMLNGTPWVEEIRSVSIPGLSSIVLVFEKGTDIIRARQVVTERLTEVFALPNVAKPPTMINPVSSANRVMAIGLTSDELSLIEMSVQARWTIVPRLMGLPGVANASIWGQRKRQLQVQVDPEELRAEDLVLMDVIKTAGNALWASPLSFLEASTPGTGGWIDTPNQRLGVRHLLPISQPEELAQVAVEGAPTKRLGDVATVVEDHQPLIGDAIVNDEPALMLVVEKFPWASTTEVTEEVEAALAALAPGLAGLEMDPSLFRPATYLEQSVENIGLAALIGTALAVLALLAFTFNWRMALISSAAGAMSVAAAATVLFVRGMPINTMVIAGLIIAASAIIDDAILDTENTARRLRQGRESGGEVSTASIILGSTLDMRRPVLYATLIMLLVVVPALFLEGFSSSFFQPLATSFMLALLASFVVALTVTPALSFLFLRKASAASGDSPITARLRRAYDSLFAWAAHTPSPAFVAVIIILVAGLVSVPFFRQESLLPNFKETDLVAHWDGSINTSHPAMSRIARLASRELRSIPGVLNVSAHVGRAVMSDKRTNINSGELWISLDPAADHDATVASIKAVLAGYPGLSDNVMTFLQARVREELSGTGGTLVVRVYGEDMNTLRAKAEEVGAVMASVDGIVDSRVQYPREIPTLEIEVDLDRAKRHGLKPGDVRRAATSLVSGIEVGHLFEEQKVFDVVVWGKPETRHSLSSIQGLLIDAPSGAPVRLQEVADLRIVPAVDAINRDAVARHIDVSANVRARDLAVVAADVERGLEGVHFPLEYRAELLGEYAERLAAWKRTLAFAIAAAIGILLLLQAFTRSWSLATAIFLTTPMTLVGGVIAQFLTSRGVFSFGAIIGFVAVLGIAVRQTMTLIDRYRALEAHEGEVFGADLVRRGTRERAGPILMTTLTTALVFLPFVFLGQVAGLEILNPLAIVVLGGLVTSTVFVLIGVPAIYLLFGPAREPSADEAPVIALSGEEMRELWARG